MRKKIFLLLCVICLMGCKKELPTYAVVSGKALNTKANTITIENADFKQDIELLDDGSFTDTLHLETTGFYDMSLGNEITSVYLKNGFDLNLNVDAREFDETLTYTGKGADENNYLAEKTLARENLNQKPKAFYTLEESAYKKAIDSIENARKESLLALPNADTDFVSLETSNLVYDSYAMLNQYETYHAHYAENPDFKVSEDFKPEGLKKLTFNDQEAYKNSQSYKNLAMGRALDTLFKDLKNLTDVDKKRLEFISELKIPQLKNDVIEYAGSIMISPSNENMEDIYNFFMANASKDELKQTLTEAYEKNKKLMKGMPSPQFVDYENHKGGFTSLTDLKGKYVYVDVWATWCGPCIREIPSLKEIENAYHNENIEFVSASIDTENAYDTWKTMVVEKELGGTQLLADNAWQSKFVKDYGINGIPRFILIDPNGNIVSADAPRPSSPALKELLDSELKSKP